MEQSNRPSLFVFMGLPASGKSTLAKAWADRHHYSYFNSDVVRKQLGGLSKHDTQQASWGWGEGIYTQEMTRRTYDTLLIYAQQELIAGGTVVLDACYGAREERIRLVQQFAIEMKTALHFVLCHCPEKVARRRLAERATDCKTVSDAYWEIFKKQQKNLVPLDNFEQKMVVSINTERTLELLLEQLDFAFGKGSLKR